MNISTSQENWDAWATSDPLWAILGFGNKRGNRWKLDDFSQTGVEEIANVMSYVESLGTGLRRGRALDFGCGVGRLTQPLAGYFRTVIGVDISPCMIELARQHNKYPDNCTYLVNETDDLTCFESDSFDFVYTSLKLQHIETRYVRNYLREFFRILAPQGLIIFELPSEERQTSIKRIKRLVRPLIPTGLLGSYRRRRYYRFPRIEMYGMKRDDVVSFLEESGGRIVDITPHPGFGWMGFRYCVTTE